MHKQPILGDHLEAHLAPYSNSPQFPQHYATYPQYHVADHQHQYLEDQLEDLDMQDLNLSPHQYALLLNSMQDPVAMYATSLLVKESATGSQNSQYDPMDSYGDLDYNISPTYSSSLSTTSGYSSRGGRGSGVDMLAARTGRGERHLLMPHSHSAGANNYGSSSVGTGFGARPPSSSASFQGATMTSVANPVYFPTPPASSPKRSRR